jgi:hypothetical protein
MYKYNYGTNQSFTTDRAIDPDDLKALSEINKVDIQEERIDLLDVQKLNLIEAERLKDDLAKEQSNNSNGNPKELEPEQVDIFGSMS